MCIYIATTAPPRALSSDASGAHLRCVMRRPHAARCGRLQPCRCGVHRQIGVDLRVEDLEAMVRSAVADEAAGSVQGTCRHAMLAHARTQGRSDALCQIHTGSRASRSTSTRSAS